MPQTQRAYQLMLACLFLLVVFMLTEQLLFAPAVGLAALTFVAAAKLLPLLAFLPGLLARQPMTAVGLSFMLLIYFIFAVLGAFEPGMPGHFAQFRCLLIAALFTGCLLFARWRRRELEA